MYDEYSQRFGSGISLNLSNFTSGIKEIDRRESERWVQNKSDLERNCDSRSSGSIQGPYTKQRGFLLRSATSLQVREIISPRSVKVLWANL